MDYLSGNIIIHPECFPIGKAKRSSSRAFTNFMYENENWYSEDTRQLWNARSRVMIEKQEVAFEETSADEIPSSSSSFLYDDVATVRHFATTEWIDSNKDFGNRLARSRLSKILLAYQPAAFSEHVDEEMKWQESGVLEGLLDADPEPVSVAYAFWQKRGFGSSLVWLLPENIKSDVNNHLVIAAKDPGNLTKDLLLRPAIVMAIAGSTVLGDKRGVDMIAPFLDVEDREIVNRSVSRQLESMYMLSMIKKNGVFTRYWDHRNPLVRRAFVDHVNKTGTLFGSIINTLECKSLCHVDKDLRGKKNLDNDFKEFLAKVRKEWRYRCKVS